MDSKNEDKIRNYIGEVCARIRNKRVHKEISTELNAHIELKINEYLKSGKSEEEALKLAVNEMGPSKNVGEELNNVHKCNAEWSVIAFSIILVLINVLVMAFFQIRGDFDKLFGKSNYFLLNRSIIYNTIGLAVLLMAGFCDYKKIRKYSKHIYIIILFLLGYTEIISTNVNKLRQFLSIMGFSINMAYAGIILFTVALAGIYDKYEWGGRRNNIKGVSLGIVSLILISFTNSFACFIVYGLALILLFYLSKAGIKIISLFVSLEILIMTVTRIGFESIAGFLNPSNDIEGYGYIYNKLKVIRESSRLIGGGVFFDKRTLPEFYGNVMFSSIIYSFGWIFGVLILMLIAILLIRIVRAAFSVRNTYGKSLILGILAILGIQFIWNILFNLGLAVAGGVMPFISYDGTSVIINMFAIGLIINVYKGRSISKIELI